MDKHQVNTHHIIRSGLLVKKTPHIINNCQKNRQNKSLDYIYIVLPENIFQFYEQPYIWQWLFFVSISHNPADTNSSIKVKYLKKLL